MQMSPTRFVLVRVLPHFPSITFLTLAAFACMKDQQPAVVSNESDKAGNFCCTQLDPGHFIPCKRISHSCCLSINISSVSWREQPGSKAGAGSCESLSTLHRPLMSAAGKHNQFSGKAAGVIHLSQHFAEPRLMVDMGYQESEPDSHLFKV